MGIMLDAGGEQENRQEDESEDRRSRYHSVPQWLICRHQGRRSFDPDRYTHRNVIKYAEQVVADPHLGHARFCEDDTFIEATRPLDGEQRPAED